jgi:hypothetical protein
MVIQWCLIKVDYVRFHKTFQRLSIVLVEGALWCIISHHITRRGNFHIGFEMLIDTLIV